MGLVDDIVAGDNSVVRLLQCTDALFYVVNLNILCVLCISYGCGCKLEQYTEVVCMSFNTSSHFSHTVLDRWRRGTDDTTDLGSTRKFISKNLTTPDLYGPLH